MSKLIIPEKTIKMVIPKISILTADLRWGLLAVLLVGYIIYDNRKDTVILEKDSTPILVASTAVETEVEEKFEEEYSADVVEAIVTNLSNVNVTAEKYQMVNTLKSKSKPTLANPYTGVTAHELFRWHLKAMENFVPHFYPDGKHDAIGFGFNLGNGMGLEFLKPHLADGVYTWEEGLEDMDSYMAINVIPAIKKLEDRRGVKLSEQQKAAIMCHAYNTGVARTNVQGCCGAKKGCGSKKTLKTKKGPIKISTIHTVRRQEEALMMQNGLTPARIQALKDAAAKMEAKWKKVPQNKWPNCWNGKR